MTDEGNELSRARSVLSHNRSFYAPMQKECIGNSRHRGGIMDMRGELGNLQEMEVLPNPVGDH